MRCTSVSIVQDNLEVEHLILDRGLQQRRRTVSRSPLSALPAFTRLVVLRSGNIPPHHTQCMNEARQS